MHGRIRQCALAGCVSMAVGGCAMHQAGGPDYRLSASAPAQVEGASMLQRGRAQLDAGLDALAIESFRAEIRFNPESADAYNGLAVAYGRIGRDDLAQRYFETALAKDPSNEKVQANLARLTGNAPALAQSEKVEPLEHKVLEPISVTATEGSDAAGEILGTLGAPIAAMAELTIVEAPLSMPQTSLASKGILSTRFAVAPAQIAKPIRPAPLRDRPNDPRQAPTPALPPATLATDYRPGGARLERVSLGEVRLITKVERPVQTAQAAAQFDSFGDRLATWLPQSIAVEQAGNRHGMIESAVIIAAVARAREDQMHAVAVDMPRVDLPEFAYLFFQNGEDAARV
ncbi:MAG: hypothetical protein IBJ12_11410 [Sphingomonadaceae bacterium]|nr:hypothetical protein [Sphingomonadaceae bacterium]